MTKSTSEAAFETAIEADLLATLRHGFKCVGRADHGQIPLEAMRA